MAKALFTDKVRLQGIIAFILTIAGLALLAYAITLPPQGEIHPSVLAAFGEIATFAGACLGIDYSYKVKELIHGTKTE